MLLNIYRLQINHFQIQIIDLQMNRVGLIKDQFVSDPLEFMSFNSLIPKQEQPIIEKVNKWCQQFIDERLTECIETAKFPEYLLTHLKALDIMKYFIQKPHGSAISVIGQGMILATIAKYDTSVATFVMLQAPLVAYTISKLGSEEQKNNYLPFLINLDIIGGWALTQQNIGSDATHIQTTVKPTLHGYILNGNKRWIGNGNRDILITWAKNQEDNKFQGFIVDMKSKGITSNKINNKLALRCVDNCAIKFNNVGLKLQSKMPKANNFKDSVEKLLKHSRVSVCWITVGTCLGVYQNAINYASNRKQFNQQLSSFQMVQQKLVKIMSNIQAMLLACWRISSLQDKASLTIGQVCMFKGWLTERGRLVCSLGRQIMGGNGIIHSSFVMKALCDMEVLYTYQGTYDINSLVAGRELTGVNAIK